MSSLEQTKAYIVGGGIASLSAAVLLIRDGGLRGHNIRIIEELPLAGGALDGSGDPVKGYVTRGGRMFTEETYVCLWNVLPSVPSSTIPRGPSRIKCGRAHAPQTCAGGASLDRAQQLQVWAGRPDLLISSRLVRRLNWFGSRSENWTSRMTLSANYREAETTSKFIRLAIRSIRRSIRCTTTLVRDGSAFSRGESATTNSQQEPWAGGPIRGVDP